MEERKIPKLLVNREEASQQLKSQIEKGEIHRDREINSATELQQAIEDCKTWSNNNKELLSKLFDTSSIANSYNRFSHYTSIRLDTSDPIREKHRYNQFMINIESYREWIGCYINHLTIICIQHGINVMPIDTSERIFGDKIFIVHGHGEGAKHKIARFIDDLDLTATILDEQPSRGHTIIDKFEEHANEAGFAIVLLTSDDLVRSKDNENEFKHRARQNVILELGYFLHSLGRERVRVLHEESVELPSDIHGIIYVSLDSADGWKIKLGRELQSVGYSVDMNKIL